MLASEKAEDTAAAWRRIILQHRDSSAIYRML